jgi:hypothetical protein
VAMARRGRAACARCWRGVEGRARGVEGRGGAWSPTRAHTRSGELGARDGPGTVTSSQRTTSTWAPVCSQASASATPAGREPLTTLPRPGRRGAGADHARLSAGRAGRRDQARCRVPPCHRGHAVMAPSLAGHTACAGVNRSHGSRRAYGARAALGHGSAAQPLHAATRRWWRSGCKRGHARRGQLGV